MGGAGGFKSHVYIRSLEVGWTQQIYSGWFTHTRSVETPTSKGFPLLPVL